MRIITLKERDAAALAAKTAAIDSLKSELADIARMFGGRFLLFGSAARDELRPDSDVDLLLDFPDETTTTAARTAAEAACGRRRLEHDILPVSVCDRVFLQHVMKHAKPIP